MNHSVRISLIILAAFLSLILLVVTVYFYYIIKRNRRIKILNNLKAKIKEEILVKADRVIIQIKKIVEKNQSYFHLLKKLTNLYDDIESAISRVNKKIDFLKIKHGSFSLTKFSLHVKKVKISLLEIDKLSQQFSELCHEFTEKDEFVRSEMVFLKNCLRDIIHHYRQNRVLLNEIASKIDELLNDLHDIEIDFDKSLNIGEIKGASAFLDLYERKVYKIALIVNEGPVINTHIFHNIPNRAREIIDNFNIKKKATPNQFSHIKIDDELNKLQKMHRQARTQFELLDFDLAKVSIRKCHEIISTINKNINLEITASNFFTQNYNNVILEISQSLQRFVALRKKFRIILDHGYEGSSELSDYFEKLKLLSHVIDEHAINLKKIRNDISTPFLAKLSQLKVIMNLLVNFVEKENLVEKMIWRYNVESIIFKNKFQKIEAAINEIIINMRSQNIIVSNENNNNLKLIIKQIDNMAQSIYNNELSIEIKQKIDGLIEKVTHLYSAIGGDLQIAEMAKNMINELTKKRSTDERLGYVLNMAEKDYMIGKYTEALNNIITFLGEKSYARI